MDSHTTGRDSHDQHLTHPVGIADGDPDSGPLTDAERLHLVGIAQLIAYHSRGFSDGFRALAGSDCDGHRDLARRVVVRNLGNPVCGLPGSSNGGHARRRDRAGALAPVRDLLRAAPPAVSVAP